MLPELYHRSLEPEPPELLDVFQQPLSLEQVQLQELAPEHLSEDRPVGDEHQPAGMPE